MNKEDVILSIKSSLKRLFSTEMKFADYMTTDGIKIHCDADKIDVGVGVQGVDEMGMFFPLDNGTYVLNEGYTINVVDGRVESVSQVAEVEDEQLESIGEEITPTSETEMGKRMEMIETQMAEILSLVNQMVKGQEKMNNTFMSEIAEVKSQPAGPSIKNDKKGFQGFSKDFTKEVKRNELDDLRKIISEKNKNNNNLTL
jgi:hypothetical protein